MGIINIGMTTLAVYYLLLIFPLAIIKNAIRIVTITLLSLYVDTAFLTNTAPKTIQTPKKYLLWQNI